MVANRAAGASAPGEMAPNDVSVRTPKLRTFATMPTPCVLADPFASNGVHCLDVTKRLAVTTATLTSTTCAEAGACAMLDVFHQRSRAESVARSALEHAENNFGWRDFKRLVADVYGSVIGDSRARRVLM